MKVFQTIEEKPEDDIEIGSPMKVSESKPEISSDDWEHSSVNQTSRVNQDVRRESS